MNNPNLSDLPAVVNSAEAQKSEAEPVTIERMVRQERDEGSPDLNAIMAKLGRPAPETPK